MKKNGILSTLFGFLVYMLIMATGVIGIFSVLSENAYETVPDWKMLFRQCVEKERTIKDIVTELSAGDAGVKAFLLNSAPDSSYLNSFKILSVQSAVAASTLNGTTGVMNLFDGDLSTSWQEGSDGYGIGEDIRFSFDGNYKIRFIAFDLGNCASDSSFSENGRPEVLTLQIEDFHQLIHFRDIKQTQWVKLSQPIAADSMRIVINKAVEGSKWNDNCISEIKVYGK